MDEKIIVKYREIKQIVADYLSSGKEDSDKFVSDVKAKVEEFFALFKDGEETKEE